MKKEGSFLLRVQEAVALSLRIDEYKSVCPLSFFSAHFVTVATLVSPIIDLFSLFLNFTFSLLQAIQGPKQIFRTFQK